MATTPNLSLPLTNQGQQYPHIPVNEALRLIDTWAGDFNTWRTNTDAWMDAVDAWMATMTNDHGELLGLADDDHPQYLLRIGSNSSDLNVTNVDTTGEFGVYASSFGPSNDPGAVSNYYAGWEIKQWLAQDYRVQTGYGTTDGDANIRWKSDGTWGSWYKLWHSGNDGAGSGLDADTLDGVDGANYTRKDLTNLGKTGSPALDATTNTAAEWSALPVGYASMMNTGNVAGGAPENNYGYFFKAGIRDTGGGWGGIWIGYDSGYTYVGNTLVDSNFATWHTVYTSNSPTITTRGAAASLGFAALQSSGSSGYCGYLELYDGTSARRAYLGFNDGASNVVLNSEGGWGVNFLYNGTSRFRYNSTGLSFFAATPVAKPTVTGSKGGNAALTSLMTALANLGLVTNSTT